MIGEYDLILRGLSYEQAREIADEAYGGSLMWHNGKAYPFDNDNPVEILKHDQTQERQALTYQYLPEEEND